MVFKHLSKQNVWGQVYVLCIIMNIAYAMSQEWDKVLMVQLPLITLPLCKELEIFCDCILIFS